MSCIALAVVSRSCLV